MAFCAAPWPQPPPQLSRASSAGASAQEVAAGGGLAADRRPFQPLLGSPAPGPPPRQTPPRETLSGMVATPAPATSSAAAPFVSVAVRVRPHFTEDPVAVWAKRPEDGEQSRILCCHRGYVLEEYEFSRVFGSEDDNWRLFDQLHGRSLAASVFSGVNETLFAYGQTGSGKTHTIFGSREEPGLLQLFVRALFERATASPGSTVHACCYEVLGDVLSDLVDAEPFVRRGLLRSEDVVSDELFVKTQKCRYQIVRVSTAETCLSLLQNARVNRTAGISSCNLQSSRTHAVVHVFVQNPVSNQVEGANGARRQAATEGLNSTIGALTLVDLAGTEKEHDNPSEQGRKSARLLNTSLSSLNRLLRKLQTGSLDESERRQSVLNRVLWEYMRPGCGIALIFCVNPLLRHRAISLSTLSMATDSKMIHNQRKAQYVQLPVPEYEPPSQRAVPSSPRRGSVGGGGAAATAAAGTPRGPEEPRTPSGGRLTPNRGRGGPGRPSGPTVRRPTSLPGGTGAAAEHCPTPRGRPAAVDRGAGAAGAALGAPTASVPHLAWQMLPPGSGLSGTCTFATPPAASALTGQAPESFAEAAPAPAAPSAEGAAAWPGVGSAAGAEGIWPDGASTPRRDGASTPRSYSGCDGRYRYSEASVQELELQNIRLRQKLGRSKARSTERLLFAAQDREQVFAENAALQQECRSLRALFIRQQQQQLAFWTGPLMDMLAPKDGAAASGLVLGSGAAAQAGSPAVLAAAAAAAAAAASMAGWPAPAPEDGQLSQRALVEAAWAAAQSPAGGAGGEDSDGAEAPARSSASGASAGPTGSAAAARREALLVLRRERDYWRRVATDLKREMHRSLPDEVAARRGSATLLESDGTPHSGYPVRDLEGLSSEGTAAAASALGGCSSASSSTCSLPGVSASVARTASLGSFGGTGSYGGTRSLPSQPDTPCRVAPSAAAFAAAPPQDQLKPWARAPTGGAPLRRRPLGVQRPAAPPAA